MILARNEAKKEDLVGVNVVDEGFCEGGLTKNGVMR